MIQTNPCADSAAKTTLFALLGGDRGNAYSKWFMIHRYNISAAQYWEHLGLAAVHASSQVFNHSIARRVNDLNAK